jgi:hypothetical protein
MVFILATILKWLKTFSGSLGAEYKKVNNTAGKIQYQESKR